MEEQRILDFFLGSFSSWPRAGVAMHGRCGIDGFVFLASHAAVIYYFEFLSIIIGQAVHILSSNISLLT